MTPFMTRVAELVGVHPDGVDEPMTYRTRPSAATAVNVGADRHVAVRSLTEQLVCEANAVLGAAADHLDLVDEAGPGALTYTVGYRGRAVRVTTRFEDGVARGRLTGDGVPSGPETELADADAVADLLISLVALGGVPSPSRS